MSKSPTGKDLPTSEGSHFSGRRSKQRQGGSQPAGRNARLKGRENSKRKSGKSAHGHEPESEGFLVEIDVQDNADALVRHGRGVRHAKKDENSDDRISPSKKRVHRSGYGLDAKEHAGSRSKNFARLRNKRPGRKTAPDNSRKIVYPNRPNRRNKGLPPGEGMPANSGRGNFGTRHQAPSTDDTKQRYSPSGPRYAALDLGTNNCRLLVAIPQQTGRFRVVDAFSRIVRLGKGLESSGRLDEAAMKRAVLALGECAEKLKNTNIKKMRLIATEACRRAENGEKFLEMVRSTTGLELEIVNRQTEAHLAAEGCGALVDKKADGAVLFDIGGGSSELILLDRRGKKHNRVSEQIVAWTSLPVGVVTLSERHGGQNVTRQIFDDMVREVEEHLVKFKERNALKSFWHNSKVHLLGTSGTVTTLAGVHLKLTRYDRRQVDGIWLQDHQVDDVMDQLLDMTFEQRAADPCIGKERADLVLAGCAILQALRNMWPSPRLRVADRGLREGMLSQMMSLDGAWIPAKKGKRSVNRQSKRNNNSQQSGRKHRSKKGKTNG